VWYQGVGLAHALTVLGVSFSFGSFEFAAVFL